MAVGCIVCGGSAPGAWRAGRRLSVVLPPDIARCADADVCECPDASDCVRWVLRDSMGPRVVWVAFASVRGPTGCDWLMTEDELRRRMH